MSGLGLPVRLALTPGQAGDPGQVGVLLAGLAPAVVIADKGYDSRAVVELVEGTGAEAAIPTQASRAEQRDIDWEKYKDRNLAERGRAKLGVFRRVATRYEKTARNVLALLHVASITIPLR